MSMLRGGGEKEEEEEIGGRICREIKRVFRCTGFFVFFLIAFCDIFTDFSGIFTARPIVSDRCLPRL